MPLSIDKGQLGLSASEKLQLLKKQLLEKANRDSAVYPLSYGQKALYFLYLNSPESPAYNVSFSARIISPLNVDALRKAFQKLVNRNSALRTNFKLDDGKPVQVVHGYQEVSFLQVDVSEFDENNIKNAVLEKSKEPFDLENGREFRVCLFSKSKDDHVLLISIHHISTDARSIEVMMDELSKLYESEVNGKNDPLLPAEKYYHDFISEQEEFVNSDKAKSQLEYWTKELSGEPADLELPNDRPRPPIQTFNGSTVYFELDSELVNKLKQVSKDSGATLFAFMLSCYLLFLRKHSGNSDIVTGIAAAGRSFQGFENVMGYFINPVAINSNIPDEMTFEELVAQTKRKVLYAVDNQYLPFQLVVEKLMHGRDASRSPVFQTFFGLQRIQGDATIQELIVPGNESAIVEWAGLRLRPYQISQQEGQFDITAEFAEGKDVFSGAFKYNTDLFDRSTVENMAEHFSNLLRQIADNKSKPISDFHLITETEKDLILNKWNNTDISLSGIDFIDELFLKSAAEYSQNIALEFEGKRITYGELHDKVDKLSATLNSKGLGRGHLAAICLERSFEMVIAMLAVLKAGGAYVPVDPDYPEDRIRFMIKDSGAKILITQKKFANYANTDSSVIFSEDFDSFENHTASSYKDSERSLDDCAYVIYTSGSTGTPKGVAISHRALANHMLWMKDISEFKSTDSVLQKTPYSFDASVWEFYLPLLNGGKLVIAKPEGHMETNYLVELVRKSDVTHIQFVPSLLKLFIAEPGVNSCASLKFVFSGGEALTVDLRDNVFEKLHVRLINLYGPTEATIDSAYYECFANDESSIIPIGKPIYNMKAFVVDSKMNLQPPGIAGELLLGGDGIAIGYVNNPELTSEKFIEDRITKSNGRLYTTGDKAKFNHNGELEYLGRIDHQVKLRGFRIELSEIESALRKYNGVKDAYVDIKKDINGRDILAAYLVASNNEEEFIPAVKTSLRGFLPEYMIPGYFRVLDELPYLPNGKVDRKKLPAPEVQERKSDSFTSAKDPIEKTLVRIWEEVLGQSNISINDNFFELGGDSIMSIQIISRAAREGIRITPKQIFSFQTIAELSKEADAKELLQVNESPAGDIKFTPVQMRFLRSGLTNPSHYNHSVLLQVRKGLNLESLDKALIAVIKQHDALRMKITGAESGVIPEESLPAGVAEFDFSGIDTALALDNLQKEKLRLNGLIDLKEGRILNAAYFRMPDENDRLLFNIHHICIDGVSWRIFLNDFVSAYESAEAGNEIVFQPKSTSFREWCMKLHEYSKQQEVIDKRNLWNDISNESDGLLSNGVNIEKNTYKSSARYSITLTPEETAHLTGDAHKAFNTSINDLLLSALAVSYSKLTGIPKLLVDLEGHGRDELFEDADISNTIGWFTSIYPVLLLAHHPEDISSVIKSVKETLNTYSPAGINYGILRYLIDDNMQSDKVKKLEPNIVFNYLGQFREDIAPGGWKFEPDSLNLETGTDERRQHLIEMNSMIIASQFVMNIEYSTDIHDESFIKTFAEHYVSALRDVLNHCMNAGGVSFTASDFSDSGLNQQELDDLLTNLN
jgi:amino acid adenylation domain-containing protein/non-ribosomal peptide synthase protein (TIGR01720 family)